MTPLMARRRTTRTTLLEGRPLRPMTEPLKGLPGSSLSPWSQEDEHAGRCTPTRRSARRTGVWKITENSIPT